MANVPFPFMSLALSQALAPKVGVIQVMKDVLSESRPQRSHKITHVSDLTNPDFCPRRSALLTLCDKHPYAELVSVALRATFDIGDMTSDLVREKWLGSAAIGHWQCLRCDVEKHWSPKPDIKGCGPAGKHKHRWKYREVRFQSVSTDADGSIDVFVRLGGLKLVVTEVKIMATDEFDKLVAPLAEHRIRTNMYMWLIEDSASPYKAEINTQQARVLYISRGHGRKNVEHNQVLPWKEYVVERDDTQIQPIIALAQQVKQFNLHGRIPRGPCPIATCDRAKKCEVRQECFSGKWPPWALH